MSDKRFEVDADHLLLVWDTEKNKRLEIEDIVALLNKQQKKIDNLLKEKILMEYQLKVQDRIIDDYERQG